MLGLGALESGRRSGVCKLVRETSPEKHAMTLIMACLMASSPLTSLQTRSTVRSVYILHTSHRAVLTRA